MIKRGRGRPRKYKPREEIKENDKQEDKYIGGPQPKPDKKANDKDGEDYKRGPVGDHPGSELSSKVITAYNNCATASVVSDAGTVMYTDPRAFTIKEFDPHDLPEDKQLSILIFGKRRTGKSFWLRWYLYERRKDFNEIYLFTKTEENNFYNKFLPKGFIYPGFIKSKLDMIVRRAKALKKAEGKEPKMFVIGDDLASDYRIHKSDNSLIGLYTEGRHRGITCAYLSQKFKAVDPAIRNNADLVIIFTQFNAKEALAIAEEYLGRLNKRTALAVMDMYTCSELHSALVIETWRNSMDPEEFLKVSVAANVNPKKREIGSKAFWDAGDSVIDQTSACVSTIRVGVHNLVNKEDEGPLGLCGSEGYDIVRLFPGLGNGRAGNEAARGGNRGRLIV